MDHSSHDQLYVQKQRHSSPMQGSLVSRVTQAQTSETTRGGCVCGTIGDLYTHILHHPTDSQDSGDANYTVWR